MPQDHRIEPTIKRVRSPSPRYINGVRGQEELMRHPLFRHLLYGRYPVWAVYKHYGKKIPTGGLFGRQKVSNRFKINAGWVLYKNTEFTQNMLGKIQQEFDTKYNNEDGWDQIQLWNHLKKNAHDLPGKYIDDGAKGGFWERAHWWHCKGPGKKEIADLESWHDLTRQPRPQLSRMNSLKY